MVFHVSYKGQRTSKTVRAIPLKQKAEQEKLKRDRLRAKAIKTAHRTQPVRHVVAEKKVGRHRGNQKSNLKIEIGY